jgi:plasmid stabilization system protein ParE
MPRDNKKYHVVFSRRAQRQLDAIYDYIAEAASHETAVQYIEGISAQCEKLDLSPLRGAKRDDVYPGLRLLIYRKRTRITYTVNTEKMRVTIAAILYGGQPYESIFKH